MWTIVKTRYFVQMLSNSQRIAVMTFALSALLVICFLLAPTGWGLAPSSPAGAELFSHLLVHQSWMHLGNNVVTLLAFGYVFERRLRLHASRSQLLGSHDISGALGATRPILSRTS